MSKLHASTAKTDDTCRCVPCCRYAQDFGAALSEATVNLLLMVPNLHSDAGKCCCFTRQIALAKLLGGRNMLQEPSAFTECDVAGDVAGGSLKKHRSKFCDAGLLAFSQVV
ncbi:hypothetical protein Nepgr_002605 [Nepenthes gracilis]|uniref:Uncharacterized protein n=1 Tax=Nepenthes gracilis TaxID=150966 RepID=A0AAD3P753_NEPGR|nr:hypothetical protein Nepgr_002605 [Nepenthes gracilis]